MHANRGGRGPPPPPPSRAFSATGSRRTAILEAGTQQSPVATKAADPTLKRGQPTARAPLLTRAMARTRVPSAVRSLASANKIEVESVSSAPTIENRHDSRENRRDGRENRIKLLDVREHQRFPSVDHPMGGGDPPLCITFLLQKTAPKHGAGTPPSPHYRCTGWKIKHTPGLQGRQIYSVTNPR